MKRLLLILVLALTFLGVIAAAAMATPITGISNVTHNFTTNPVAYGGTTSIVVGVAQNGGTDYVRNATFTLTGLPPQLIFTGHGDTDTHTVCSPPGTTGTVTCTYTDAAYDSKHDPFYFEVNVPTTMGQCKKGGWMDFGGLFKNQGDCVSFIATGGRNLPTGALPSGTYTVRSSVAVDGFSAVEKDVSLTIIP